MPEPVRARSRRAGWAGLPEEAVAARATLFTAGLLGALIAVYTSAQSALVFGAHSFALRGTPPEPAWELLLRTAVNFVGVGIIVLGIALWHPERQRGIRLLVTIAGIAAASTVVRAALQAFTVYDVKVSAERSALLTELVSTALIAIIVTVASLLQQWIWRRLHRAERTRMHAQDHVVTLLQELQEESLRVRREVALTLHGTVQSVFVVLAVQLNGIADELDPQRAARVRAVSDQLDRLREGELREVAAALYPQDLERGLQAALTTLLARVPVTVALTADVADAARRIDAADLDITTRVLLFRILEEGIVNALRHGRARALDVSVRAEGGAVEIVVDQDGVPPAPEGRRSGLAALQRFLDLHDGTIELTDGGRFGAGRLRAYLPRVLDDAA